MPYRPGDPEITPPTPTRPKPTHPSPPSYSAPAPSRPSTPTRAVSAYTNPDMVSRGSRTVYRPQVAPAPPPYHYNAPSQARANNPTGNIFNNPMGQQIARLMNNGGSDYEVSLALDAAIQHRYKFIVSTQKQQADALMNHVLTRYADAQDALYNNSFADGLLRELHGKDANPTAPNLHHVFQKDAMQAILPNSKDTLKQFNDMTQGMDPKQLGYMGSTFKNMLFASEQEHGNLSFDKSRLRSARDAFKLAKHKTELYDQSHGISTSDSSGSGSSGSSSLYGDQVKSKDSGLDTSGGSGGFWGHVGGAIGDAAGAVGGAIKGSVDAADSVTNKIPGVKQTQDSFNHLWDSNFVEGTRHILGEDSGAALSWSLDKLSRPLYSTADAVDTFANYKGQHGLHNLWDIIAGSPLTGINTPEAIKHYLGHPTDFLRANAEATGKIGHDLTADYNRKQGLQNPTTFGKVISNEAKRDTETNMYDNKAAQTLLGLSGDFALDPANLAGVGFAKVPVQIAKAAGGTKKLGELTQGISDVLKESHGLEPKDIERILTGGSHVLPRNVAERVNRVHNMLHDSTKLSSMLDEAARNAPDGAKATALKDSLKAVVDHHEKLVRNFGAQSVTDAARSKFARAIAEGRLPESSLTALENDISTTAIQKNIYEMIKLRNAWSRANKAGTDIRQELGLSQGAGWDEVLPHIMDSPAYKGRLAEFEAHAATHEGPRAFDLLPDAIKHSGLFKNPQEFDDLLGNAYRILKDPKNSGDPGVVFRRLESTEKIHKRNLGTTTDEFQKQGIQTSLRHVQGKKARVQAAVVLQMIKDAAARSRGETVFRNKEYAGNMQRIIDEVDRRLAQGAVGGGTADIKLRDITQELMDTTHGERQAMRENQGHSARNFTDIMPHINEQTGEFSPELFASEGGHYSGEQQLDRIRQFAERGLARQDTMSSGGIVKSFGPLSESSLKIDLPEHLQSPDVLRHHLQISKSGEVDLANMEDLTPEDRAVLSHLRDSVLTERESIFDSEQAANRARKSDKLNQDVENAYASERKGIESAALKGFENRVVRNADGISPYLEHDGEKILQGTTKTSKLVTPKDQSVADRLKNALDAARYPGKTEVTKKDIANLRWLFSRNGAVLPRDVKSAEDLHKFLKGNKGFHDWLAIHMSGEGTDAEIAADASAAFKAAKHKKDADPWYRIAQTWTDPGHIAFNRIYNERHGEMPWQTRETLGDKVKVFKDSKKDIRKAELRRSLAGRPVDNAKGYDARRADAAERAFQMVYQKAIQGDLKTSDFSVNLHAHELPNAAELTATMMARHAAEVKGVTDAAELKAIKANHAVEAQALAESNIQGKAAVRAYQKALLEHVRLANIQSETAKHFGLQLRFGNDTAFIPAPDVLMRGADRLGGLPLIKQARQFYSDAFGQPTRGMDLDLQYARAKRMSQTPKIIEHNVKHINSVFKGMDVKDRRAAFAEWRFGGPNMSPAAKMIDDEFKNLLPYFTRQVQVPPHEGALPLTVSDINRFLPEKYRSTGRGLTGGEIQTPRDLVESLKGSHDDPYDLLWHLNIGTANAEGNAAMRHVINSTFGIKRYARLRNGKMVVKKDGTPVIVKSDLSEAIEALGNADTGWKTIPRLGNTHYFPGEIAGDINRMLDAFEPQNINKLSALFDQGTRAWKGIATIYNPGYYTRNGIGEMMATWMAGHQNPKDYVRAAKLIRYMRGDGKDLESIGKAFPLKEPLVGAASVKGHSLAFTMRSGEPVTVEKLALAVHDQAIAPGFINTEAHNIGNVAADRLRTTPVIGQLVRGHQAIRNGGEDYETYLRSAHFIAAIRKSNKPFEEAIKDAAAEVRKYHFDYTDFSKFEKTVMLRAIPFYKWTRRAIPLYFGMMFAKPGKMTAYAKAANAASNLLTSQDVGNDPNGLLPNYHGIVPSWMQDLMAYQVSGDTENGLGDYMNLAQPQMDSLKSGFAPLATAYNMSNPLVKVPVELAAGHTLGGEFGGYSTDLTQTQGTSKSQANLNVINELLGTVPEGTFMARATLKGNHLDKGELRSFITGLGDYENTPARQYGELMSRRNAQN